MKRERRRLSTSARAIGTTMLAIALFLSAAAAPSAEPLVDEDYAYYDIEGDREDILLEQLEGVGGLNGFHAQTTWYVRWSFDWRSSSGECSITGVRIDVDIEYLLPRWLGLEESRNSQLVDRWSRYQEALLFHEHGHGEIAIEAGRKVEAALLGLPSFDNCDSLSAEGDALAMSIVEDHQAKNERYDQMTDHGVTQGAVFP